MQSSSWAILMCTVGQALQAVLTVPDLPRASSLISASAREEVQDQAARGKTISVSEAKPGDLLFYASGDYINHVAIYIGGGQVIHASNPTTGICITPANYRTPCKAVTFWIKRIILHIKASPQICGLVLIIRKIFGFNP